MTTLTKLPPDLLTIAQAADRLGISPTSAWRRAEAGELPGAFQIGALWRVSAVRLERFIHGDTTLATSQPPASDDSGRGVPSAHPAAVPISDHPIQTADPNAQGASSLGGVAARRTARRDSGGRKSARRGA